MLETKKLRFLSLSHKTLRQIADATFSAGGFGPEEQDNIFMQPGRMNGQGIYLGQYSPIDRDGFSLNKTFNVFAAPEDLPGVMTYKDTVKHVAELKGWFGYDGTGHETEKGLYAAIRDGGYNGGWFIPTLDILCGKADDGCENMPDNILAHKDTGAFSGTFKTAGGIGDDCPDWYWSCREHCDDASLFWVVHLLDREQSYFHNDTPRLSCRPVRLATI